MFSRELTVSELERLEAVATAAVGALQMDEDTFRAFYDRTARQVWAYLARITGDRTLADDLLQESYYRFLRRMDLVASNPCDMLERPRSVQASARGLTASDIRHLLEIVPPVFARPIGWPRCPRGLRGMRIRPIERNGRGVLMHPGGREGIHFQRFEDDGAIHLVKIGRKQCLEDVSQPIIIERGPCEARLQQRHHATCFQPFPHLIESMIAIQNREDQSFDPTPTREHMGRMGRDETIDKRGDLQAS